MVVLGGSFLVSVFPLGLIWVSLVLIYVLNVLTLSWVFTENLFATTVNCTIVYCWYSWGVVNAYRLLIHPNMLPWLHEQMPLRARHGKLVVIKFLQAHAAKDRRQDNNYYRWYSWRASMAHGLLINPDAQCVPPGECYLLNFCKPVLQRTVDKTMIIIADNPDMLEQYTGNSGSLLLPLMYWETFFKKKNRLFQFFCSLTYLF